MFIFSEENAIQVYSTEDPRYNELAVIKKFEKAFQSMNNGYFEQFFFFFYKSYVLCIC